MLNFSMFLILQFVVLVSVGAVLCFLAITNLYLDKTYSVTNVVRTVLQQSKKKDNDTGQLTLYIYLYLRYQT